MSSTDRIVKTLRRADAAYEIGRPVMSDAAYDRARGALEKTAPAEPYLKSVGGPARARRERLPIVVGSLDKLRPSEVAGWMRGVEAVAPQRGWLVLPKFDGQSVTILYDRGVRRTAWTRGRIVDGHSVGQNVSEAVACVQGARASLPACESFDLRRDQVLVRGEVVMHTGIWNEHYQPVIDALRARIAAATDDATRVALQKRLDEEYQNPRNMCAGLLNRLDVDHARGDLRRCTFVALQIFRRNRAGNWVRPGNAHREWVMLALLGFTTAINPTRYTPGHDRIVALVRAGHACLKRVLPVHDTQGGIGELAYWDHHPTAAEVTERLAAMRRAVDVRLDGLVVMPISYAHWVTEGDHLAPRPSFMQSIKLESHDQDALDTAVGSIEWRISKRGMAKPRLVMRDGLDFDGAEVNHATLNNAAFVRKWGLRPGRPIRMVRSGDVIPRLVAVRHGGTWVPLTVERTRTNRAGERVVERVDGEGIRDGLVTQTLPTRCPSCTHRLRWNRTRTDLCCDNEQCVGRHGRQCIAFFKILGVDDVAGGVIEHMMRSGMHTVEDILNGATAERLMQLEGYQERKARIVSDAIAGTLRHAPLHKIMHASGAFADENSSLGSVRLQDIVGAVGEGMIERATDAELRRALTSLHGLGSGGLALLLAGLPAWRDLWSRIRHHHTAVEGPQTLAGRVIAFTGFRDASMQEYVEQRGGRVSGLSRKTSVLFSATPGSTKAKKADQLRIPVVSQADAWAWLRKRGGS